MDMYAVFDMLLGLAVAVWFLIVGSYTNTDDVP